MSSARKRDKDKFKKWLKDEGKFCTVEEATYHLKDFTYRFIYECIDELNNEGYFIRLIETEEMR
jgi:hypothetical protein